MDQSSCSAPAGTSAHSGACSDQKGHSAQKCCSPEEHLCKLVSLAGCAKKELLKDKIKAKLETKIGKKLDQVADLAVDSLLGIFQAKVQCAEKKAEAVEKLEEIFKA